MPTADLAAPMLPVAHRVLDVTRETHDVVSLALEACRPAEALDVPQPGQFDMCWVFGVGEVPISVSEVSSDGRVIVHTVRDVGPVTHALCTLLPGSVIGLRGPFGTGWEIDRALGNDAVVLAGGIGLAPLRAAIESLLARHAEFRRVAILVGARSPDDLLYSSSYPRWQAVPGARVEITVDAAGANWRGHVGVITTLLADLDVEPARTTAFMCGPEVMMRFASRGLLDLGVPADAIRVSLERNMQCGVGQCGHCQLGGRLLCRDGPVVRWSEVAADVLVRER